ncbi:hypothetical protein LPE509_02434 [Legionella pneumophila subsp. pneumophila LPE509]|nr:hypothetical protein LPE509_02434 [Legionella pneumophila subsp. pneumophila LPE509]
MILGNVEQFYDEFMTRNLLIFQLISAKIKRKFIYDLIFR